MQNNFQKIPFISSLLFFVFSGFSFYFLYIQINNYETQSSQSTLEWKTEASRRNGIRTLNDYVKAIAEERANLDTHFARSSDIVPLLDSIEALGPKTGVQVQITSVDIPAKDPNLLVGINVVGSFSGLYKFITLLENFSYELDFITMDIYSQNTQDVSKKIGKTPTWEMNLKVRLLTFIQ